MDTVHFGYKGQLPECTEPLIKRLGSASPVHCSTAKMLIDHMQKDS